MERLQAKKGGVKWAPRESDDNGPTYLRKVIMLQKKDKTVAVAFRRGVYLGLRGETNVQDEGHKFAFGRVPRWPGEQERKEQLALPQSGWAAGTRTRHATRLKHG